MAERENVERENVERENVEPENVTTRGGSEEREHHRQEMNADDWLGGLDDWTRSVPEWREIEGWIREHPEAAMAGAAGVGVLAGSLLFPVSRPAPRFSERMQAAAFEVGDELRDRTGETRRNVSRTVGKQAERASKEAAQATESARQYGQEAFSAVRERARENPELTQMVANALYSAAAAVLVKKITDWVED